MSLEKISLSVCEEMIAGMLFAKLMDLAQTYKKIK